MTEPLAPGSVIGVFGAGQLGRMLGLAARRLGFRVHTFTGGLEGDTPTGQVADLELCATYDDDEAIRRFVQGVDVVTFEFENVDTKVAAIAADLATPVRPGGRVVHAAQDRRREKAFLVDAGLPTARHRVATSRQDLEAVTRQLGDRVIVKTAASGYDGKGQVRADGAQALDQAWDELGGVPCVIEEVVDFEREASVVAARSTDGSIATYGLVENDHVRHILDLSRSPARVHPRVERDAIEIARIVLTELDVVGVLCVELFVLPDGGLVVNELAPRPHNSGHLTIEAAVCDQFEQQARAVCGLPLGSTERRPAAMANLLGELWDEGEPPWEEVLRIPDVHLHLYGKAEARPGRKMGHLTAVAPSTEEAVETVRLARNVLGGARA